MDEQCFYCQDTTEDVYHAQFIQQNEHVEKPLCYDCYKDWLEGIKG
ncbi:hypothetical protein [Halalkalibacter urbisdiaboli]|nr:hypothetical protein [Halalkalibacter urbisdiaboli]